jgi:hypothetical protein
VHLPLLAVILIYFSFVNVKKKSATMLNERVFRNRVASPEVFSQDVRAKASLPTGFVRDLPVFSLLSV